MILKIKLLFPPEPGGWDELTILVDGEERIYYRKYIVNYTFPVCNLLQT